jgi:hypothetical protein
MGMPTMHFGRRGRSPPLFNGRRCTIWHFPIGACFGGSHYRWVSIGSIANLSADGAGNQQRFDHGATSACPARPIAGAVMTETEMQARNLKKIGDGGLLPAAEGFQDDFLRTCLGQHSCGGCGLLQQALCNGLYRFMTESARQSSPHTLRHTTAMHLLQSGVPFNVIALWLGHESATTARRYAEADLAMKEKALTRLEAPDTTLRRFKAPDSLMRFLQTL